MDNSGNTTAVENKRWSEQELGSIRGTFTYTLMTLQERLQHLPNPDKVLLPVIDKLDWDVTKAFWRGTIMDAEGNRPANSAYTPHQAAIRILLHINTNAKSYKLDKTTIRQIDLTLTEILQIASLICSPARSAFSSTEQTFIRSRLTDLFPTSNSMRGLSATEQDVVRFFLDSSNFDN